MSTEPSPRSNQRFPTGAIVNIILGSMAWGNLYLIYTGQISPTKWYVWPILFIGIIVLFGLFFSGIAQLKAWYRKDANWFSREEEFFNAWTVGWWNVAKYVLFLSLGILVLSIVYKLFDGMSKESIVIIFLLGAILMALTSRRH